MTKITRRAALSTAGKAAIGAAAVIVVGGGTAAYFLETQKPATTSTNASTNPSMNIPVGFVAPLTGSGYYGGQAMLQGVTIANSMINDSGGVLGRKINMIPVDDQSNAAIGLEVIQRLVEAEHVVAITGCYYSFIAKAEIDYVHSVGIPYVQSGTGSDSLREKKYEEEFFTTAPVCAQADPGVQMIKDLAKQGKVKNVQAIVATDEFDTIVWGTYKAAFDAAGINYKFDTVDLNTQDFTSLLLSYKAATPRADLFMTVVAGQGVLTMPKQAAAVGYAPTTATPYALDADGNMPYAPNFWQINGKAGLYWLMSMATLPSKSLNLSPLGQQVTSTFTDLYKSAPNEATYDAFDGFWAVAKAIEAAGSTDSKAIIAALENINVQGTRENITFPSQVSVDCEYHNTPRTTCITQLQQENMDFQEAPIIYPLSLQKAQIITPT